MYDYKITVIEYALNKLIESVDGKDDESSNIIRESAKRAKATISHVIINGANDIGTTFEEFIECLNNKPNIYILSDEEEKDIKRALSISEAIHNIDKQI